MIIRSVQQFRASVGTTIETEWTVVGQDRIQQFADTTGDHQWIHVDVGRSAEGPYGRPIAHGYLLLSLMGGYLSTHYAIEDADVMLNYGADRVRFTAPVLAGASVRGLLTVSRIQDDGETLRAFIDARIQVKDSERPACLVQQLLLVKPGDGPYCRGI